MTQKILMNVSDGEECRIAVTQDGLLQEYFLDRPSQLKHVGDIYRGVVSNTEPAIQAVFVDIGYKKNAFLHASDIIAAYNPRASLTEIYGENPVEVIPVEEIDFDVEPEQVIELEEDDDDASPSETEQSDDDVEHVDDTDSGQEKAMRETVALEKEGGEEGDGERRRGRRRRGRRGGRGRRRGRSADGSNENGEPRQEAQASDGVDGNRAPRDDRRDDAADSRTDRDAHASSGGEEKPARKKRVTKKVAKTSGDDESQDSEAASKKVAKKKTAKKTTVTKKAAAKKTATKKVAKKAAAKKTATKKAATKKAVTKKRATKKLASHSSSDDASASVTEQSAASASGASAEFTQGRWNDGLNDDDSNNMPGGSTPPVRFRREVMPKVQNIYRRGQHVLVQVLKAAQGGKGPGVTTYISLPGRYMVLMPNTTKCGVSRKIQDRRLRSELRRSLSRLRIPENMGVIIRTAAAGRPIEELQRDLNYLLKTWNEVLSDVNSGERAPSCSYRDTDPATRTVRDYFTDDVDEIVIDDKAVYDRVANFFDELMPDYRDRVKFYDEKIPLFTAEGVEAQIEHIFDKKVPLPSGGYLFIEQTEALIAIDVNSGRFTSEKDAEETAYKTNMEAIPEITRQLRLRDLGGIIVNDFIDMMNPKYRRDVEDRLRNELHKEKTRVKVAHVSPFGLIEMTRQRVRPSLRNFAYDTCGHCHGSGMLKSAETQALTLLRTVKLILANDAAFGAAVQAPPEVLSFLHSNLRDSLTRIEKDYKKTITFEWSSELGPEEMRFFYVNYRGDRTTYDHVSEIGRYVVAKAPIANNKRSRRRRGGRGGRGRGGRDGSRDSQRNEAVQGSEGNAGDATPEKSGDSSRDSGRNRNAGRDRDSGRGRNASRDRDDSAGRDENREEGSTRGSGSSRRGGRRRSSGQRRDQAPRDENARNDQRSEQSEAEAPKKKATRRPSKKVVAAKADGDAGSDAKPSVTKKTTKKAAATKKTATKKAATKKAATKKTATKKAATKKTATKKTAAKKAPRKTKKKAASSADTQES